MARPRFHALLTIPVAWHLRHRWGYPGALALALMGIFIDGDHLIDWAWMRVTGQRDRFLAPLHAWELLGLSAGLAWWLRRRPAATPIAHELPRMVAGLTFGWWLHLTQDMVFNRPDHAGAYSLIYRIWQGFDRDRTGWGNHKTFHQWGHAPWWTWL